MFDLIELILNLFTNPLLAFITIVLVGGFIFFFHWLGTMRKSRLPLNEPPEVILQHALKFTNEDLVKNRTRQLSDAQRHQLRRRFVSECVLMGVMGVFIIGLIWLIASEFNQTILTIGMGLFFLFIYGFAIVLTWRYVRDLKSGEVLPFLSPLIFRQRRGEHMTIPIVFPYYDLMITIPGTKDEHAVSIGMLHEHAAQRIRTHLHGRQAVLYLTPYSLKLLSFELLA